MGTSEGVVHENMVYFAEVSPNGPGFEWFPDLKKKKKKKGKNLHLVISKDNFLILFLFFKREKKGNAIC
jgi:hypothetical protein